MKNTVFNIRKVGVATVVETDHHYIMVNEETNYTINKINKTLEIDSLCITVVGGPLDFTVESTAYETIEELQDALESIKAFNPNE